MAKIVGVVATRDVDVGGGAPIFYAKDREHLQAIAHLLEKVLDSAAHEVNKDLFIIVNRN
jgi:diaminopimelate decarboxylase